MANAATIKGQFAQGHNVLRTRIDGVYFRMEKRKDGWYQTAFDQSRMKSLTERFDFVIGSGRKGQSYLYWRDGLIFQLPVSYLTGLDAWINSPGYLDGQVDFGRFIPPRCLECHTTTFNVETVGGQARFANDYELGLSCSKCHGDGRRHIDYHTAHRGEKRGQFILAPRSFSRDRKLDACALCHGGARAVRRPPFSYRPGERLDDYYQPAAATDPTPDVHGNQVGLLQKTKCFRSAPNMTCSTCHDVHRQERDLTAMGRKCRQCHQTNRHPNALRIGGRMLSGCIDCHMPNQPSKAIEINTRTTQFSPKYRSHAIAIYPEAAAAVLGPPSRSARP